MGGEKIKLGVLVSGRGTNLQAIIDRIEDGSLAAEISILISNKENAHALERGRKHGIEPVYLDPKKYPGKKEYDRALIDLLKSRSVQLVCLAGFMRILGEEFIHTFAGKILNIHPSLLPAFPGLEPQKQALEKGVRVSGCTVHFVGLEVDAGPIVLQASVPVYGTDDVDSLSRRILELEHIIYPRAIGLFQENRLVISGDKVIIKND